MKLYLFNPDTDLALACNSENYMAPASARLMARDLALLPIWYAQPGSAVLAPSAYNADFLEQMRQLFPLQVQLATEPELPDYAGAEIIPWGWNPAIRKYLLKGGVAADRLPASETLGRYRELASRGQVAGILNFFADDEECCGESGNLYRLSDCRSFVESHECSVLKAPWSGSGKGLNWCKGVFTPSISGWCERILREQGFVAASPLYNKVEDFAMEFHSDGCGCLRFAGYSLFSTNSSGAYTGNMLLSAEDFEKRMERYIPLSSLTRIRRRLQEALAAYSHVYTGYFGVDMMVCTGVPPHKYLIHPCVEVNLRMNMGVVAHQFCQDFLAPGRTARFLVEYHSSAEDLQARHRQDREDAPPLVADGRLLSGYLPLVPVTRESRYRAYVKA